MSKVEFNSDILFLYDAKLCNPNGDPDDENKPRMDYERNINLVSDVRLKRYVRDYLQWTGQEIFVARQDEQVVTATERIKGLLKKEKSGALNTEEIKVLLDRLIDVRLFGATMPIKNEEGKGSSTTFTGPVQFNWGYSLNKTRLVDSSGITSHFSSESTAEQGTMGKDYRVYYSLIAFHGIVSARRGEKTFIKKNDLQLLDEAIIKSIPLMATRSKIGQYPRLYLRVEYKDDFTFLGDLRSSIGLANNHEGLRDISEVSLDVSSLYQKLAASTEKIGNIYIWQDAQLDVVGAGDVTDEGIDGNLGSALAKAGLNVKTLLL